ncbi:MAG: DMT family transporter, partial [Firmicutes bacterium]|nr:DMT family transporter [Bacillota bacterium]
MTLKKHIGKICILVSAFVYGLTPILAKTAYSGGTNGITLTFLRAAMTVPLLFFIMRAEGVSTYISPRHLYKVCVLGVLGGTLPIALLYMSYSYIPTGLATTLHFIYPIVIVFVSAFMFKERITPKKLLAVVLVTVGIIMFTEIRGSGDRLGIILALLSGVFYSFYVIYLDASGLDKMNYLKLTFYLMLTMSASSLIFGLAAGGMDFDMTPKAWIYSAVISILVTLVAVPAFQAGIKREGAATAGILSAFEPMTTTALG